MYNSIWNKVPFVRFLAAFAGGITISLFFHCEFFIAFSFFILFSFCFLTAFFFLKKFRFAFLNGIFLSLTLFFGGISLNLFQNELFHADHFSKITHPQYLIVVVNEPSVEKIKSIKLLTKALSYADSLSKMHPCSGNLALYLAKDSVSKQIRYGDIIIIKSSLIKDIPPPQNPDEFDYKRYLRFNNIHFQAYAKKGDYEITHCSKKNILFSTVYDIQTYFKQTLSKYIPSASEAGVAEALLYGYDDEIDPDIVQAYANTGTLHVLAVSGMHVGLIYMILGMMLKFMDRSTKSKNLKCAIIITGLWIYSLLCGLSPSILRATVMFSFIIAGQMFKRPTNVYNTLAVSAFMLLCSDTNMIANVGFQLSYMAVLGIVFIQPYIYEWYDAKSYLGDEVWKIISVSIAAQLGTFPLGLLYFHQFPNYFLFSNLIIIPLTTIIIYIGIILLLFSKISFIAVWLGKLVYWSIALTNGIVKFVEQLPFSYVNGIHISIIQSVFIFGLLAFFISYFLLRRSIYFKWGLAMCICFFGLSAAHQFENHLQKKIVVYNISNQTSVNFIHENNSTLIIDSALWNDRSKVRFHMQQHFWHSGSKYQKIIYTDTLWRLLTGAEKKIIITGNGLPFLQPTDTAISVLIIKNKIRLKEVIEKICPRQVIITSAIKPHIARTIKLYLKEKNIPCTVVGESGAFDLSL